MIKKINILGNGKSLAKTDYTKLEGDTIGLCQAFREWYRIGWFPSHYACIDSVVCKNNVKEILQMIKEKRCKKYLLSIEILKICPEIQEINETSQNIYYAEHLRTVPNCLMRYMAMWCSGSAAYIMALMEEYDDISIYGVDCNYVEFLPECEKLEDGTLRIKTTPVENPNYFFNDYQREGDVYNIPNAESCHSVSWDDAVFITSALTTLTKKSLRVVNYNVKENTSLRNNFDTIDLE